MYVLCFRMRSIMDIPRLKSQLLLMPIETILKHDLNPLKVSVLDIVIQPHAYKMNNFNTM